MKSSKYISLAAVLFALLLVAACSPQSAATPTEIPVSQAAEYQAISVDDFATLLENEADNYTVVNVHIPYEGEIAGTDMHVAFNDTDALTSALPDKDAPIVLYCQTGYMSGVASRALVDLGYTNVLDVTGGMNAWRASGRELEFQEQ